MSGQVIGLQQETRQCRYLISQCPLSSTSVFFAGCGCILGAVLFRRGWMGLLYPSGTGSYLPGTTNVIIAQS